MTDNRIIPSQPVQTGLAARLVMLLIEPHPSIKDHGERRRATLLSTITLLFSGTLMGGLLSTATGYATFVALLGVSLLSYALSRGKYYRIGTYLFSYGTTLTTYVSLFVGTASSFGTSIASTAHISLIVASVLLSLRGFAILVVISAIATFTAPLYSLIPIPLDGEYLRTAGVFTSIGLILAGASAFRSRIERERLKEVNAINRELESLAGNLDVHVKERTEELDQVNRITIRRAAQLQTIADLSQSIARVRDPKDLFPLAAQLISDRFGFYHVGIFLLDQNRDFAVLQAANSEGGQKMLNRHHRLMLGTGVVGFAAQTGKPRIALDVGEDAVFFNNPDLPATRSEVALPLRSGEQTIGVLDVQSTEPRAFSEEDLQVLTTLANQVAIALENSRLLDDARTAAKRVEDVYNEFVRTEWTRTTNNLDQSGFRYNTGRIELIEQPIVTTDIQPALERGRAVVTREDGADGSRFIVSVPVRVRNEVVGILRIEPTDTGRNWREEELSLMEAVAERAALALENARLFQDARRRAAKERLITEATSRISGSLNIENILQTTASELERVLGGSEIVIQFGSRDSS